MDVWSAFAGALIAGIVAIVFAFVHQRHALAMLKEERAARMAEHNQEEREWYRRAAYEHRLLAVQEAYTWLSKLNVALNQAKPGKGNDPQTAELLSLCEEARSWYDNNVLWLHDGLPEASPFIALLNSAALHGARGKSSGKKGVWEAFFEAERVIRKRADDLFSMELRPFQREN